MAERLAEARAHYTALDYDEARSELMLIVSDPRATDDERFEAHLLAGIINRVMEHDVEARGHFLYVLKKRPDHQLPDDAPPKIRSFFELVRLEVAPADEPAIREGTEGPGPLSSSSAEADDSEGGDLVLWTSLGVAGGVVGVVVLGAAAAAGTVAYLAWPKPAPGVGGSTFDLRTGVAR